MGKKILAISTSLRTNGNSETLLDSFIEGAKASVTDVGEIKNHPALKQAYKMGLKA